MRERHSEIEVLITKTKRIRLYENQCFYTTHGAFEIWEKFPLQRIKRIPHKQILWVIEKEKK